MDNIKFHITGMKCPSCVAKIEGTVGVLKGVTSVSVDFEEKTSMIEFDGRNVSEQDLMKVFEGLGYHVSKKKIASVPHRKSSFFKRWFPLAIAVVAVALFFVLFETSVSLRPAVVALWTDRELVVQGEELMSLVAPGEGVDLGVKWGGFGKQLVDAGVIDRDKFADLYSARGGLTEEARQWLDGVDNGTLKVTKENAPVLLNLLWAFGLSNKNSILDTGPMVDPQYEGAGGFASTGGWSLSVGDSMNHYSRYSFVPLTSEQQLMVERTAKGIHRPCCNNPVHFPDCNHGMAMLGFLEIMASQGATEDEMYRKALVLNSYWFPDTYSTIARLFQTQDVGWSSVDPKMALGFEFSSASGYRNVLKVVQPEPSGGGQSCGV